MRIVDLQIAFVALVIMLLPSQASAREQLVFEASSPWAMDYAEDSCALRRMFRNDSHWVQLELRGFSPGSGLVMTVSTNSLREAPSFKYRIGAGEAWRDPGGVYAHIGKTFLRASFGATLALRPDQNQSDGFILSDQDKYAAIDSQAAAGTTEIAVTNSAFGRELVMHTGPMAAPWEAMQTCLDELLTHRGLNSEEQENLQRPATPISLAAVRRMMVHPPKGIAKAEIVNLWFAVDATGSATKCSMQAPRGLSGFEAISCDKLDQSVKFEPALDRYGVPVNSYWDAQINFGELYVTFSLAEADR